MRFSFARVCRRGRRLAAVSTVLALLLCSGCASLKPSQQTFRDDPPTANHEAAWCCLGFILEIVGPILACH
jgi:hypothetical protein